MLRIEKIVLQGFKSFKKRVTVPFPSGFSCVTGPNGSGKTNVLDAIVFVLGRTSSKTLRAPKTENLVFHGSKDKTGADFASVALYFDNTGKELPFEEGSVSISRRVNKKGVSTYRLNGKVVTRQQVVDVLSQAGLRPDGHNIIQQGDVNQIVEMDPVERREIIDEISGIAEYDDKKNKANKELAKIDEKLKEADIILEQKQQVMDKLKQERDAALAYKRLEDQLAKMRASLVMLERSKSEGSLKDVNRKLDKKTKEFDSLGAEIEGYDNKITELEDKMDSIAKSALKVQDRIDAAERGARLESEIELKKGQIESNRREIDRIQATAEQLSSISTRYSPAFQHVMEFKGVKGSVADLIKVPAKYKVAVEVSGGSRLSDIVVDTTNTAVACVKYLKKNRIGRARFLPMDKIKIMGSRFLPKEAEDWMSNLISFGVEYKGVMEYIFGNTACVKDIDTAKGISKKQRLRMVTMDGDLMEASGAITGGFYKAAGKIPDTKKFAEDVKALEEENTRLAKEVYALQKEVEIFGKAKKPKENITAFKEEAKVDVELKKCREKRKAAYEKRLTLQQDISRLNIERAKLEAHFDNLKSRWDVQGSEGFKQEELKPFMELGPDVLRVKQKKVIQGIQDLGPVNLKALQDFEEINTEFEEFKEKVEKIASERKVIEDTINQIEGKRLGAFTKTLTIVSKNFKEVYRELTGGEADLGLEVDNNLDSGLMIQAKPPGKKLLHIDAMSGGEKTLTAFAFIFATQRFKPAPFYILDEADAALDKANTKRVVSLLRHQSRYAQYIVISHNDHLVKEADHVYGVTMENGESKVFGVKLPKNN